VSAFDDSKVFSFYSKKNDFLKKSPVPSFSEVFKAPFWGLDK
jgi:hypothetical protein